MTEPPRVAGTGAGAWDVCAGSAAVAALAVAAVELVVLASQPPLAGRPRALAVAGVLVVAALLPSAVLIAAVEVCVARVPRLGAAVAGAARRAARGVVGDGWARPAGIAASCAGVAWFGTRYGAETVAGWLPDAVAGPWGWVGTLAAVGAGCGALGYLVGRLAGALVGAAVPAAVPALAAAVVVAVAGGAAVVAGGDLVVVVGGRDAALVWLFWGVHAALAAVLSQGRQAAAGRWPLRQRLLVAALLLLVPAGSRAVGDLHRWPDVREVLVGPPEPPALASAVPVPSPSAPTAPERRARARRQRGHPRYNVVLITVDSLRADHLSVYGYDRPTTPRLAAFFEDGGTRFLRAWSQTPSTRSSVGAAFYGRYTSELRRCGHRWPHFHPDEAAFPELVRRAGHATAGVPSHGWLREDNGALAGFEHLDLSVYRRFKKKVNWRASGQLVTERAMALLDTLEAETRAAQESGRPQARFLLWLHYYDPHSGYIGHPGQPRWGGRVGSYDGEILYTDRQLAPLLDRLDASPRREDTAVILHADHAEGLNDHGHWYHGRSLLDDQIRIPLLIRTPGASAAEVRTPASNIDLAPTILDLMGVPLAAAGELRGRSLVPLVLGAPEPPPGDRPIYAEMIADSKSRAARAWIRWPWKLTVDTRSGRQALYDLAADPTEQRSVLRTRRRIRARMAAELDHHVRAVMHLRTPETWPGHERMGGPWDP